MSHSGAIFLARYYLANLLRTRIMHGSAKRAMRNQTGAWTKLHQENLGKNDWLVVGNGPSLKVEDLEALQHLPSVASNKITLLYESTGWRPAIYTIADPLLLFKLPETHYDLVPMTLLPTNMYHLAKTTKKMAFGKMSLAEGKNWFDRTRALPEPLGEGLISAKTVTTLNIQLAMWCGAKRIFLIGLDHNYKEEPVSEGVKKMAHGNESNHFHSDYRKPGEIVNAAPINEMERGYQMIADIAKAKGIEIWNVTRKTALQTYPRATVEDAVAWTRPRA